MESLKHIFRSQGIRRIGLVLLGGILIILAFERVEPEETWQILRQADLGMLSLAVFSVAINTWAKAARWQGMLAMSKPRAGFGSCLNALIIGQVTNWFMPGRVGDLGRAYLVGRQGSGGSFALGTIVLEKVLDMICYLLIFIFTLLLVPLPEVVSRSVYILAGVTILLGVAVFIVGRNLDAFLHLIKRLLGWTPVWLQSLATPRIETAAGSLKILGNAGDMSRLALWSCVVWGTAVWTNHLVLLALGVRITVLVSFAILVVVLAGSSIPSVPGKFGVFQYLCIITLSIFNIDPAIGLSYGILLQAIVYLPAIIYSLVLVGIFGVRPMHLVEPNV